jgi:L-arabinose isomerase
MALRVGLFAIGLEAYWKQFAGLEQRLTEYAWQIARGLGRPGLDLINLGMIDSPEKAAEAATLSGERTSTSYFCT